MRNLIKFPLFLIAIVFIMGNSHPRLYLEQIIANFEWKNRLVLLLAKDDDTNLIRGVEAFFETSACQNENRNLVLYKIIGNEITKYNVPKRYQGKTGIWLIGYDGEDKAYSQDLSLLDQLHKIIDEMPMRQNEMVNRNSSCD